MPGAGRQDCFALFVFSGRNSVPENTASSEAGSADMTGPEGNRNNLLAPRFSSLAPFRHKKALLVSEKGSSFWSADGDGITNRLIHFVQGDAPALGDVPPPPDALGECLRDWEAYLHHSEEPTLITCALMHYQFEAIHPFLDGNGRIGRLLTSLLLCEKGSLTAPNGRTSQTSHRGTTACARHAQPRSRVSAAQRSDPQSHPARQPWSQTHSSTCSQSQGPCEQRHRP